MPNRRLLVGMLLVSCMVLGQSCSISFGNPAPSQGGVYRSDDNGQTWKQRAFVRQEKKRAVTIAGLSIQVMAFPADEPDRVYIGTRESGIWRSLNRGDRWESTSLKSGRYACISIVPSDADEMYTSSGASILRSTDGGKNWRAVYLEAQAMHTVDCVLADPNQAGMVWAVTSGGKVLRSEDSGETWTLLQTIKRVTVLKLHVDPIDGRLIVFGSRGITAVAADGSDFEDLTPALQTKELRGATDIRTVTISPQGEWYLGTKLGPVVSSDGGQSWELIPTVISKDATPVTNLAVNPNDANELFMIAGSRLHHTADGGTTWAVNKQPTSLPISQLMYHPTVEDQLWFGTFIPQKK